MEAIPLSEALALAKHLGSDYCAVHTDRDPNVPGNRHYPAPGGCVFRDGDCPDRVHYFRNGWMNAPARIYKYTTVEVNGGGAVKWAMENPGQEFFDSDYHYRWTEAVGIEFWGKSCEKWLTGLFDFRATYTISGWVPVTPEVREK